MNKIALAFLGFLFVFHSSCSNKPKQKEEMTTPDINTLDTVKSMNSFISLFEIPADNMDRAVEFYQSFLGIPIQRMDIQGMELGILPYQDQTVHGVIIKGEGYTPSADGTTLYFDAGENLEEILKKVEQNGGTVLIPKTAHVDNSGFFALFLDSEGNKLGLNATN